VKLLSLLTVRHVLSEQVQFRHPPVVSGNGIKNGGPPLSVLCIDIHSASLQETLHDAFMSLHYRSAQWGKVMLAIGDVDLSVVALQQAFDNMCIPLNAAHHKTHCPLSFWKLTSIWLLTRRPSITAVA
jgi:hypothetical protein